MHTHSQDFEALTPNLLARTVETVEGGGLVVVLLRTMTSLQQLYTLSMDVHARYRTEAHQDVVARFNERYAYCILVWWCAVWVCDVWVCEVWVCEVSVCEVWMCEVWVCITDY